MSDGVSLVAADVCACGNEWVSMVLLAFSCYCVFRCSQCEQREVCGWCPYHSLCASSSSKCYSQDSWIHSNDSVCGET